MKAFLFCLSFLICSTVFSATETREITYSLNGKTFKGLVVKPVKTDSMTKTIMIVHEWWGLDDYPKMRAEQLAKKGFIAFCVDMYGEGQTADNPADAQRLAGEVYSSQEILKSRFMAAYEAIVAQSYVNRNRMAAIGYCFGGTVVLNAAKMGAPLDAVVSFHGGLQGVPENMGKMQAAVLVCNGEADKMVTQEQITAFKKSMEQAGNEYTFIDYPDATHAFTNPAATEKGQKFNIPIAYNAKADKKSFKHMLSFLKKEVR